MAKGKRNKSSPEGNTVTSGQPPKDRWHSFTSYLKTEPIWDEKKMTFLAYGKETCPTTGRHHWQGFIRWKDPKTNSASGKALENAHSEIMIGTIEQNEKYCSKEGEYKKFGQLPKQGARTDLEGLVENIMNLEITTDDVCTDNPFMYHMYGRTLDKAEDIALRKKFRTEMTQCVWYHGKTGVGKSHKAFENYTPETHYIWTDDRGWWDGYRQQEIVIINDFRGQIKYSELLELIDKWPKKVRRRNREPMPFTSKMIIITSVGKPEEVYHKLAQWDSLEQLHRRITLIELTDDSNGKEKTS